MPKGAKTCPKCQNIVGCRTLACKCGYQFFSKNKSISNKIVKNVAKPLTSNGRGRKTCGCGTICGVRTKICPVCQKSFQFIPSFMKKGIDEIGEIDDWTKLDKGDHIKIVKGTGPYCMITDKLTEERRPEYMGYSGKFEVHKLDSEGIHVYPLGKNSESGHCFILMVTKSKSKYGTILEPHKIIKLKKRER